MPKLEALIFGQILLNYRQARDLYFRNEIKELGLGIDFNFLEFDVLENSLQMTPFISTGISFLDIMR